jgi:hypothetical protein
MSSKGYYESYVQQEADPKMIDADRRQGGDYFRCWYEQTSSKVDVVK